ncbi:MAG TPA: helical backbone metal receptor [Anaerolineales bacterium]|nr:helical backbone metal receptor [Anaerolineales bacterium]
MELGAEFQIPNWDKPPKQVVSLVPSITESLFALGFGDSVVGVTDYCIHPKDLLTGVERIGGPKTPKVNRIVEIAPDLVIADQEENDKETIFEVHEAGLQVWVTATKTVDDSLDLLRQILALYHTDKPVMMINSLQIGVDYARAAARAEELVRYFCPIWYQADEGMEWWMTFNRETYVHDLLGLFGGVNVFATRERRYPLEADLGLTDPEAACDRDTRYPRVRLEEVQEGQPDVIFLPDDPFKFSLRHKEILVAGLKDTPAVRNNRIYFLDGSLITWPGVRLGKALQEMPGYFYPGL